MLGQPCVLAQASAAASNFEPAPRLRCPSATIRLFSSARVPCSTKCVTLTCVQPTTPASGDSATNSTLGGPALSFRMRRDISLAFAGYPSSPLNSAILGTSELRALRITKVRLRRFTILCSTALPREAIRQRASAILAAIPAAQNVLSESRRTVTGPSLVSSTDIVAWKTPVATTTPSAASAVQNS